MLRIFFFILTFSLSFALQAKKLIIVGDSLTEGYGVTGEASFPKLLDQKFKEAKSDWQIVASGSSGSTSASTLSRLKWVAKQKPDSILILMGSNDGLRGLGVEQTEKNLNEAVAWALKQNIKVILGQLHAPPNYGKEYTKKFLDIFPKVAKKNKIKLAPFILNGVAGDSKLNQADGIHPNEKGHKIIAENLYKYLSENL